jgi:hypothetical protein
MRTHLEAGAAHNHVVGLVLAKQCEIHITILIEKKQQNKRRSVVPDVYKAANRLDVHKIVLVVGFAQPCSLGGGQIEGLEGGKKKNHRPRNGECKLWLWWPS